MTALSPGDSALVLEPGSPRPAPEIGRVLAYHLGLHPSDAIARARYGGGILLDGVPGDVAESLVAPLRAVGVAARRVEASLLRDLPRGQRARSLALLEGEIRARIAGGGELSIARADLFGIHLHALSSARDAGPAEPASPGPLRALPGLRALAQRPRAASPAEERSALEARWFRRHHHDVGERVELSPRGRKLRDSLLDASDPPPKLHLTLFPGSGIGPLRLLQEDIDYSSLGERKMPHSLDNFLELVVSLRAFAPKAWMGEKVEAFLERLDPLEILYFKPEESENFERWMQVWIRICKL